MLGGPHRIEELHHLVPAQHDGQGPRLLVLRPSRPWASQAAGEPEIDLVDADSLPVAPVGPDAGRPLTRARPRGWRVAEDADNTGRTGPQAARRGSSAPRARSAAHQVDRRDRHRLLGSRRRRRQRRWWARTVAHSSGGEARAWPRPTTPESLEGVTGERPDRHGLGRLFRLGCPPSIRDRSEGDWGLARPNTLLDGGGR